MPEKKISLKKKPKNRNAPLKSRRCSDGADIKGAIANPQQCVKTRRTVKLPRLKLEDLVVQVTEENAQKEISTGTAVGNEVW